MNSNENALNTREIEKQEFWGTTKASFFASFGFALGALGCFMALAKNIEFLSISMVSTAGIIYALILNFRKGLDIRWRFINFMIHIFFLISIGTGIAYVIYKK
ncbi:MAG TPA: hypothetical protein VIF82_05410 [Burkholderiaceae bacterium]|jgi:hypothetical protein